MTATLAHRCSGSVPSEEPSRWLQRLCFHFSRKIAVQWSDVQGDAEFPWGHCALRADEQALHFDCTAASADELAHLCSVIDQHVALFSRKQPMQVSWSEPKP